MDFLPEQESTHSEKSCPEDSAGGVKEQKAAPRHPISSGKECGERPEDRDEAAQEDDLAAIPLEEILPLL
jgi:hypothetical protein